MEEEHSISLRSCCHKGSRMAIAHLPVATGKFYQIPALQVVCEVAKLEWSFPYSMSLTRDSNVYDALEFYLMNTASSSSVIRPVEIILWKSWCLERIPQMASKITSRLRKLAFQRITPKSTEQSIVIKTEVSLYLAFMRRLVCTRRPTPSLHFRVSVRGKVFVFLCCTNANKRSLSLSLSSHFLVLLR